MLKSCSVKRSVHITRIVSVSNTEIFYSAKRPFASPLAKIQGWRNWFKPPPLSLITPSPYKVGEFCGSIMCTLDFGFTLTSMCVSTVYSVLSQSPVKKHHSHITWVGCETHDPCISRAVPYQLDYRGCPGARGSSNPMFRKRVPYSKSCSLYQSYG